jgi:hypothetical protein
MFRAEAALARNNQFQAAMFATGLPPRKPCRPVPGFSGIARSKAAPVKEAAPPDPLFLFHCATEWHKTADTASGWELVHALRSQHRGARALAAELLAETENGRLLVRDLRRTRGGLHEIKAYREQPASYSGSAEAGSMNTPYGLQMVENCASCALRKEGWYCALSADLLKSFSALSHLTTYPGNALLFVSGQIPRGAFVLCSGRVKL